jgi:hypothetical protein
MGGPQSPADAFASDLLMRRAEHAQKLLGALAWNDDAILPLPLNELVYDLS